MEEKVRKVVALARDLANKGTDSGLDKAADILLHLVDQGNEDPEILVQAATYLLQGPRSGKIEIKEKAIGLVDQAVALAPENIIILENAIHCYELTLNNFPDKMSDIIRLSLKILDIDPDHVEAMITLAYHREYPGVSLGLDDAIRMLEWAKEVDPKNVYVDYTLGRLYMEAGEENKAKQLFQSVIDSNANLSERLNIQQRLQATPDVKFKSKKHRKYGLN